MDKELSITAFAPLDLFAASLLVTVWLVSGWLIERPDTRKLSVSVLMAEYRREWMRQFVTRIPRIFDANVIDSLRQGTSFLASACMIAIGGGIAMIGNRDRLGALADDLELSQALPVIWEMKILFVIFFVVNAFLKFIWAHRLFGYCSIIMAAVPNEPEDPRALIIAGKAAEINIRAAKGFNRGLRSIYFALGALSWLLGAPALIVATVVTLVVVWRREYGSHSRIVLLDGVNELQARHDQL